METKYLVTQCCDGYGLKEIKIPVKIHRKALTKVYFTWEGETEIEREKAEWYDIAIIDFEDGNGPTAFFLSQLDRAMIAMNSEVPQIHHTLIDVKKKLKYFIDKAVKP